jgi:uncharacterized protein with von Willebrand factor type A (vWA) domain
MGGSVMEKSLGVLFDPFSLFQEVAAEVVEYDMELFAGMERQELIREIKEFDAAFALIVTGMDLAGSGVQGRKKRSIGVAALERPRLRHIRDRMASAQILAEVGV